MDLRRTLNTCGKTTFVKYYDLFLAVSKGEVEKNAINFDEDYKDDSKITKINAALLIFNNTLNIEALKLVINAKHGLITEETKNDAIKLYNKYYGFVDEIDDLQKDIGKYNEGEAIKRSSIRYERNRCAREQCLQIHGYTCKICNFNFASVYGDEELKRKIHVHHIKQLSEIKQNYLVDPENDLMPVCPNCHAVLHSKGIYECFEFTEVQCMLKCAQNRT